MARSTNDPGGPEGDIDRSRLGLTIPLGTGSSKPINTAARVDRGEIRSTIVRNRADNRPASS